RACPLRAHRGAAAVRQLRAAAQSLFRRPARAHRAVVGCQHAGDAGPAGRCVPLRPRRAARHPAIRGRRPRVAHDSPRAPARFRRRHRSRRVVRRADYLRDPRPARLSCAPPGCPGYVALPCVLSRHGPRFSFFLANSRVPNRDAPLRFQFCGADGARCREAARTPWKIVRDAAEGAYDRTADCRFTTFVGYEWTSAPGSNNLHRNVIFRTDAVPDLPVSHVEAPQPEQLWQQLADACGTLPGCEFLTIPHNSNLSNGLMFQPITASGAPLTAADAGARAAMEPLAEVMQHKGDSECQLGGETTDELCGFEKLPYQNFMGNYLPMTATPSPATS